LDYFARKKEVILSLTLYSYWWLDIIMQIYRKWWKMIHEGGSHCRENW
jgi:hypothetical protein